MSIASRTVKPSEEEFIPLAQLKATEKNYREWVIWMRDNFSYAQAVRMCTYMNHSLPGRGLYNKMRVAGMKLKEVV